MLKRRHINIAQTGEIDHCHRANNNYIVIVIIIIMVFVFLLF